MGKYIAEEDVKVRLIGKVQFTEDAEEKNRMHISLLRRLIDEAESEVELDLMPRYDIPLHGTNAVPYSKMPSVTRNLIRTLCELQSVMRVLETDFGRGTITNGNDYSEKLKERYQSLVDRLMSRNDAKVNPGWKYPPMYGLELAYFNSEADDGYAGMPMNISPNGNQASYPSKQMNEPSESWWNASFEGSDP